MLEYLFSKPPTMEERLRDTKKQLGRAQRELARERIRLEREETTIVRDLKKVAEKNPEAGRMYAKNLIRHRNAVKSFYKMEIQLKGTLIQLQLVKSSTAMSNAMRETARVLYVMNNQCNLPQLQRIMKEFEKQNEFMEMKQEIMDDTIDGVMEGDDDSAEEDEAISKVLEEIGVETASTMSVLNRAPPPKNDNLIKRINNLKK